MDGLKIIAKHDNGLKIFLKRVKCFSDDLGVDSGLDKCEEKTFKKVILTKTLLTDLYYDTKIREFNKMKPIGK